MRILGVFTSPPVEFLVKLVAHASEVGKAVRDGDFDQSLVVERFPIILKNPTRPRHINRFIKYDAPKSEVSGLSGMR